ncbi:MAG: cytochrome P460 family protein [Chitinophagaceae bacterium]|nr:cytochrome P460 family protein [Chitinophagaceae bacterium]
MRRHYNKFIILGLGILVFVLSISFKTNSDQKIKLLEIAKEYKTYAVYTSSPWKWTIALCSSAHLGDIDSVHFISSADAATSPHGNKMYKFFVKDMFSYNDTAIKKQPFGQVLVKETWNVKEVSQESVLKNNLVAKRSENDGKWYMPTTISELFIMYKEKENNDNDKGWVYGIVSLEDNSVKILTNGKISSCISCHKGTKYDRVFGMEEK